MSKTAAMLLQEVSCKHCLTLRYEELPTTLISQVPQFKIRVKCSQETVDGVASTKKKAKQDAAMKMLILLRDSKKIPAQALSDLILQDQPSPLTNKDPEPVPADATVELEGKDVFINYVGQLQELCNQCGFPDPSYTTVDKSGMSHFPTFVISCSVSSVKAQATGNTKKKAKQEAAKKVLSCISKNLGDQVDPTGNRIILSEEGRDKIIENIGIEVQNINISDAKLQSIQDNYKNCKGLQSFNSKFLSHQHLVLKSIFQAIPQMHKENILLAYSSLNVPTVRLSIQQIICTALKTTMIHVYLHTRSNMNYMVALKLCITPAIVEIGTGVTQEDAKLSAFRKLLDLILCFMQ